MNQSFETILNHPVMESLGWVLLHFLWQGAAVAVVLFLVLTVLRRVSANARYLTSCFALLMTATLPGITWTLLPEPLTQSHEGANEPVALAPVELQNWTVSDAEAAGVVSEIPGVETPSSIDLSLTPQAVSSIADPPQNVASILEQLKHWLRPWIPFLTCAWLAGVLTLSTRLLFTWIQVQRLQQRGVQSPRPEHQALLQRLAERLKISQTVRLLESIMVEVPTVIGWLKPVILLPVASVNSLTVQQLEAILVHELAHIRRADYAVNLVQSLIETLLFYHPAVWWMSSRIRQEREHCCDDLATSISGDAASYVAALVRMEELRCEPRSVAVAARGGDLLIRAKRLLVPSAPDRLAPRWLTGVFAMAIAAAIVCVPLLKTSQAEPATAQAPVSNKKESNNVDLDRITPAEIADRIEEAQKRYASVEYTATGWQNRSSQGSAPGAATTPSKEEFATEYRSDGDRWFVETRALPSTTNSTRTTADPEVAAFDGERHQLLKHNVLRVGEDDSLGESWAPAEMFWRGVFSSDWIFSSLRSPEARLVGREQVGGASCLHVEVKYIEDKDNMKINLFVSPEQGWLLRRFSMKENDESLGVWTIDEVATTESGLHYPAKCSLKNDETAAAPFQGITITRFQERNNFEPHEFQISPPSGIDVVDYRLGVAWHNDPWWNELAPWAQENLVWPQPDLQSLSSLDSNSPRELAGTAAPELLAGKWLTPPGNLAWDRPERRLTIMYFFGGSLLRPTPEETAPLEHLNRKYAGSGLEIIGIASHSKTPQRTRQAIRELNVSFPVMMDSRANEADISNAVKGASWGANYVRYQVQPSSAMVLVNQAGRLMPLEKRDLKASEVSPLEQLVRQELLNSNGTSDPTPLRKTQVNRISRLVRGAAASPEELAAAVNDQSPLWFENAQQAISSAIPDAQREFLKSRGMTIQTTLQQLSSSSMIIPDVAWHRLVEEWKRRATAMSGNGVISGRIRQFKDPQLQRDRTIVRITPVLRVLSSNVPGVWKMAYDNDRARQTETDQDGLFTAKDLPKGSYQITVDVVGKPRVKRMVHLITNESSAALNIVLSGGATITGQVTDVAGKAIPGAVIKPVKRYATQEAFDAGQHTTEDLPPEIQSDNGRFTFDRLFEGAYQFRVSAEGFKTTTTEPVAAGTALLPVVLKPAVQDQ